MQVHEVYVHLERGDVEGGSTIMELAVSSLCVLHVFRERPNRIVKVKSVGLPKNAFLARESRQRKNTTCAS